MQVSNGPILPSGGVPHLAVKSLEVAWGAQEDVLVGLEDLSIHDDTGVAEYAVLPLLVELSEELTVVRGDLHVLLSVVHLCFWTKTSPPNICRGRQNKKGPRGRSRYATNGCNCRLHGCNLCGNTQTYYFLLIVHLYAARPLCWFHPFLRINFLTRWGKTYTELLLQGEPR